MYQSKITPIYEESPLEALPLREAYKADIAKLIEARKEEMTKARREKAREIAEDREKWRQELKNTLGWPLTMTHTEVPSLKETVLKETAEERVSRLSFEIFPGFHFNGIFLRHLDDQPRPTIFSVHGGAGTCELCSSFYPSLNYNDMSVRIFRQGANVFAPQLLIWRAGPYFKGDSQRAEMDQELRRLGGSIAALEIFCMSRCVDALTEYVGGPFGLIGLSYGGFYSLYTAACDPRFQATLNSSFFTDRAMMYGSDFAWNDSLRRFSDAEVGALVCPRALRIEWGHEDWGKHVAGAAWEMERLEAYFAERPEQLSHKVFYGVHEFNPDDDGIFWIMAHLKPDCAIESQKRH